MNYRSWFTYGIATVNIVLLVAVDYAWTRFFLGVFALFFVWAAYAWQRSAGDWRDLYYAESEHRSYPPVSTQAYARGRRAMLLARELADRGYSPGSAVAIGHLSPSKLIVSREEIAEAAGVDNPSPETWDAAAGVLQALVELSERVS